MKLFWSSLRNWFSGVGVAAALFIMLGKPQPSQEYVCFAVTFIVLYSALFAFVSTLRQAAGKK